MARSYHWELWGKHFRNSGNFSGTTPHDALMILLLFGNWGQILCRLQNALSFREVGRFGH